MREWGIVCHMVYVKFLESDEAKVRVVRLLVQVVRRPVAPHSTIPKNFSYINDRLKTFLHAK